MLNKFHSFVILMYNLYSLFTFGYLLLAFCSYFVSFFTRNVVLEIDTIIFQSARNTVAAVIAMVTVAITESLRDHREIEVKK